MLTRATGNLENAVMSDCPVEFCILCYFFSKGEQSVNWCSECGGGICSACSDQHLSSNDFSSHKLVPIVDSGKLYPFSELKLTCTEHNIQNEFYCKKHRIEVCPKCLPGHRGCNIVCTFENSKESFKDFEALLLDIKCSIDKLTMFAQENSTELVKQREKLKEDIRVTRITINQTLNELEAQINQDLLETESNVQQVITTIFNSMDESRQQLGVCEAKMSIIRQYTTDLSDYQVFLSKMEVENKALEIEESVLTLITNKLNHFGLSLKVDDAISEIKGINEFGKIIVEKGGIQVLDDVIRQIGRNRIKRTGMEGRAIDNIQLTLTERIDTRWYEIGGCAILPGGKMIISRSRYPSCFTLLKSDGSVEPDVDHLSYGISPIDDSTIALSSGISGITIFDLINKKTQKTYACSSYGGIAATDTTYVYCTARNMIETIDKSDYSVSRVCTHHGKGYPYIAVFNNNIYITNASSHFVECFDIKGRTLWKFKDTSVLMEPRGITIDGNGNIYITDSLLSKVIIISPEGDRYLELLNREDGVNEAWGIFCERDTNKLLVANKMGTVLLFQLDYN